MWQARGKGEVQDIGWVARRKETAEKTKVSVRV